MWTVTHLKICGIDCLFTSYSLMESILFNHVEDLLHRYDVESRTINKDQSIDWKRGIKVEIWTVPSRNFRGGREFTSAWSNEGFSQKQWVMPSKFRIIILKSGWNPGKQMGLLGHPQIAPVPTKLGMIIVNDTGEPWERFFLIIFTLPDITYWIVCILILRAMSQQSQTTSKNKGILRS